MWYGSSQTFVFRKPYKNRLARARKFLQKTNLPSLLHNNYRYKTHTIHLPTQWNLTILSSLNSKAIFLTNSSYFFQFSFHFDKYHVFFDQQTHTFLIHDTYLGNFFQFFCSVFRKTLYQFSLPVFLKLKFKGKGYYIYKNRRNTVTPQFGHSHRIYIYSYFTTVKFLSKTSVLLFGFSKNDLFKTGYEIKKARPINLFTGRGVRFNRQILYRKTGKISTHR